MNIEFKTGDMYAYESVTQGYLVVWTRGDDQLWHASDEARTQRGAASDDELSFDEGGDWIFARGSVLPDLMDEAFGKER